MQRRHRFSPHARGRRADAGRLEAAVFRFGDLLGWRRQEVIAFAEALTSRPWQHCGRRELERVLVEYEDVAQGIAERRRHRLTGRRGGADADRA